MARWDSVAAERDGCGGGGAWWDAVPAERGLVKWRRHVVGTQVAARGGSGGGGVWLVQWRRVASEGSRLGIFPL